MELTRRDALAVLAGTTVLGGGTTAVAVSDSRRAGEGRAITASSGGPGNTDGTATDASGSTGPLSSRELNVLVAAAEVLYPSEVEGVRPFVETYVRGRAATDPDRASTGPDRAATDPDHAAGIADAAAYLDDYAESWYDAAFASLDTETREATLDRMGLRTADPDPGGSDVERVRYYVHNELLYGLYASPTGGELVGIENPQGHPGGTGSYRRGPDQ